jgi:hypothetical protein
VSDRRSILASAAEAFGFHGTLLPSVRYGGAATPLVVGLDEQEIERRRRKDLASFDDYWSWQLLADLPEAQPLAWEGIDPMRRAFLQNLPKGVVEATTHSVTRVIRPAVRPLLAIELAPPQLAVWRVSTFAPFAHRAVLLRRANAAVLVETSVLGVGVALLQGGRVEVIRRASAPKRTDAFGYFLLCERLFSLVLQESAGLLDG